MFFSLITAFSVNLNITVATNIIIAGATCIAVYIHFDSIKHQKQNRIWDTNKEIIIKLTSSLHELIDLIHTYIDCYHTGESYNDSEEDANKYKAFSKNMEAALNVYRPLMSPELVNSLTELRNLRKSLIIDVNRDGMDILEAYEIEVNKCQHLHSQLLKFIGSMSGIK